MRERATTTTRRAFSFAALLILGGVGLAQYREHAARARGDELRARRAALEDGVARFETASRVRQAECQKLLAAAVVRRGPLEEVGGRSAPPPTSALRGTSSVVSDVREQNAPASFFGPYACEVRPLPEELATLQRLDDAEHLAELEAALRREEEARARAAVLPSTLSDMKCTLTRDGTLVRCTASWWKAETGEVIAVVRRSNQLADTVLIGGPEGDMRAAIEDALRDGG